MAIDTQPAEVSTETIETRVDGGHEFPPIAVALARMTRDQREEMERRLAEMEIRHQLGVS